MKISEILVKLNLLEADIINFKDGLIGLKNKQAFSTDSKTLAQKRDLQIRADKKFQDVKSFIQSSDENKTGDLLSRLNDNVLKDFWLGLMEQAAVSYGNNNINDFSFETKNYMLKISSIFVDKFRNQISEDPYLYGQDCWKCLYNEQDYFSKANDDSEMINLVERFPRLTFTYGQDKKIHLKI